MAFLDETGLAELWSLIKGSARFTELLNVTNPGVSTENTPINFTLSEPFTNFRKIILLADGVKNLNSAAFTMGVGLLSENMYSYTTTSITATLTVVEITVAESFIYAICNGSSNRKITALSTANAQNVFFKTAAASLPEGGKFIVWGLK